jgi:predicted nucleic acid-binding protein
MLYPNSKPSLALLHAAKHHELVLSDHNIAEFRRIAGAKFSRTQADIEIFLAELRYFLIFAPHSPKNMIADPKDAPILNAAILEDLDIIISGDKHFLNLDIERPKIMTAAKYLEYTETED